MNKKFCKTLGLAILLASSLPFSLVSAETFEEVPTGETTISSMADDPLKEYNLVQRIHLIMRRSLSDNREVGVGLDHFRQH